MGPYDAEAVAKLGSMRSILAHLALFGILASFIQASLWSWTTFTNHSLPLALAAIILAALYGVSDEIHQSFVAGRYMTASDILANTSGAVIAVATLQLMMKAAFHSSISPFKLTPSKA